MARIGVQLRAEEMQQLAKLANELFGYDGPESMGRVVEVALMMRLFWAQLVGERGIEVEEPVIEWDNARENGVSGDTTELQRWLFGKERSL